MTNDPGLDQPGEVVLLDQHVDGLDLDVVARALVVLPPLEVRVDGCCDGVVDVLREPFGLRLAVDVLRVIVDRLGDHRERVPGASARLGFELDDLPFEAL